MLFTEFNVEDALEVRYEEGQQDGIQQGQQKGRLEGQQSVLRLMSAMLADGRADELPRLQNDQRFLKEMAAYYHIEAV